MDIEFEIRNIGVVELNTHYFSIKYRGSRFFESDRYYLIRKLVERSREYEFGDEI